MKDGSHSTVFNRKDFSMDALQKIAFKRSVILTGSVLALLLLMLVALSQGSSGISFRQMAVALMDSNDEIVHQIVFKIRLPRILAAVLAGAALSVSGAVIQTVIRNPLGSPYTLGLSAASMFGAALAIVTLGYLAQMGMAQNLQHNPYIVTASAFVFGLLCALLITGFARWGGATPETLVMAGIILSALFGSATSLMQYVSNDVELAAIVSWMFGDLGKATIQNTWLVFFIVLPSIAWFLLNTFNLSTSVPAMK
ncbi:iron(III) dicitrate transport system permease protein [Geofilum rubicundum JCM 15548]|uniref:Iron(III) dicitrate transport system permease protein n=1 Tax=Geofilum rubicundum JCM 15548 TaxID=1236989 RepID=A0A0E9M2G1_9BACT|nr:iron chelate uptake ABC transporter family permease subunit [Geofilum rubicundum]GAO31927.1 iron(III) dicitrate transport system permease protein [Geofilum rubicundum JCM 15548]